MGIWVLLTAGVQSIDRVIHILIRSESFCNFYMNDPVKGELKTMPWALTLLNPSLVMLLEFPRHGGMAQINNKADMYICTQR